MILSMPGTAPGSEIGVVNLGETLYVESCAMCHSVGEANAAAPALVGAPSVDGNPERLISVILFGSTSNRVVEGREMEVIMPPQAFLTDDEVATISTYVRSTFGSATEPVSAAEVARVRSEGSRKR